MALKGYDWIGTYYPKKKFEVKITDNVENPLAGLCIPMNALLSSVWVRCTMWGVGNSNPEDELEYFVSGRIGNIPTDLDTNHASDVDLDKLVGHYLPMQIDEQGGEDPDSDTDEELELSGHVERSDHAKAMEWLHREDALRYPKSAVVLSENTVRFHTDWSSKKDSIPFHDVLSPQIMALTMRSDVGVSTNDWEDVIFGGAADINTLSNTLVDNLEPGKDGVMGSYDAASNTVLTNWLSLGYNEGSEDYEDNEQLYVKVKMTCKVDMYIPKSRKYYSGG